MQSKFKTITTDTIKTTNIHYKNIAVSTIQSKEISKKVYEES